MAGETKIQEAVYIGSTNEIVLGNSRDCEINPSSGYDFNVSTTGSGAVLIESALSATISAPTSVLDSTLLSQVKSDESIDVYYNDGGGTGSFELYNNTTPLITCSNAGAMALTPETTFTSTTANYDTTISATGTGNVLVNSGVDIQMTSVVGFDIVYNTGLTDAGPEDFRLMTRSASLIRGDQYGALTLSAVSGQPVNISTTGTSLVYIKGGSSIEARANEWLTLRYNYDGSTGGDNALIIENDGTTVATFSEDGLIEFTPFTDQNFNVTTTGTGDIDLTAGDEIHLYSSAGTVLNYGIGGSGGLVIRSTAAATTLAAFHYAGQINFTPTGDFSVAPTSGYDVLLTTTGSNAHIVATATGNLELTSSNDMVLVYDKNGSGSSFELQYGTTPTPLLTCSSSGDVDWDVGTGQNFTVITTGGDINLTSGDDINHYSNDYASIIYNRADSTGGFVLGRGQSSYANVLTINQYGSLTWETAQHLLRYNTTGGGNYFRLERNSGGANRVMEATSTGATTFYGGTSGVVATFGSSGDVSFDPASGQNFEVTTLGAGDIVFTSSDSAGFIYNDTSTAGSFYITNDSTPVLSCNSDGQVIWVAGTDENFQVTTIGSGEIELDSPITRIPDQGTGLSTVWLLGEEVIDIDLTSSSTADLLTHGIRLNSDGTATDPFPTYLYTTVLNTWTWSSGLKTSGSGPGLLIPLMRSHNWEASITYTIPATMTAADHYCYIYFGACGQGGTPLWWASSKSQYNSQYNYVELEILELGTSGSTTVPGDGKYNSGGSVYSAGSGFTLKIRNKNGCISVWDDYDDSWHNYEGRMNYDTSSPYNFAVGAASHVFLQASIGYSETDAPTFTNLTLKYLV